MDQQPPFENPYASPAPPVPPAEPYESADRAVWGDNCVTFAFQPSVEDYEAAQQFLAKRQSAAGKQTRPLHPVWLVSIIVLVILFVVATRVSPAVGRISDWLMIGLFSVVAGLLIGFILFFVLGRLSGGLAKLISSDPEEWLSRMQVTIGPDGLITTTPAADVLRRWQAVEEAAETDDYIFLVRKAFVLMSIPKRIFTGPDEAGRVARLVRSFLPPSGS